MRRAAAPYMLLAPSLVWLTGMFLLALVVVGRLSLFESNFIHMEYVGFRNYIEMAQSSAFRSALLNSLLYVVLMVPPIVGVSLWVALRSMNLSPAWQAGIRILYYAPSWAAGVIIASVWRWLFHPAVGGVNYLLAVAGLEPVVWFSSRATSVPVIALILDAGSLGAYVTVLMAAAASVPRELLDAARIDGAGERATRWRVVLPAIAPVVAVVTLAVSTGAFKHVETLMMLAPYEYAATLQYQVYQQGWVFGRFGLSSAFSVALLLACALLVAAQRRLAR